MRQGSKSVQKGRQLVLKLKEVQEENVQLERELQGQDAALRQAELHAAQLAEVQTAAKQMLAHNRMLQLQVEDAVAQAATLRKVRILASSFPSCSPTCQSLAVAPTGWQHGIACPLLHVALGTHGVLH